VKALRWRIIGLLLQPFCGFVLDALGLKIGLALFAGAWAAITMAHGLANTWPAFASLRALMGVAEGRPILPE
jgi:ACS family hexuronate transporter-like MFS transporter